MELCVVVTHVTLACMHVAFIHSLLDSLPLSSMTIIIIIIFIIIVKKKLKKHGLNSKTR